MNAHFENNRFFWTKKPLSKGFRIASRVIFGIIAAGIFALVFGFLVMALWNWLMPLIFGLTEITYWQSFGIVILVKLIFGALGRGGDHSRDKHWFHHEWEPTGEGSSRERWSFYRDYWKDEGKKAFEEYMKKRQSEECAKDEQ
jgi:sterol desaturase/sphingolipid hydroxylase (fatty acid hydroxylase superfamily)